MSYRKLKKQFMKKFQVTMFVKLFDKEGKTIKNASKIVSSEYMKEVMKRNDKFYFLRSKDHGNS